MPDADDGDEGRDLAGGVSEAGQQPEPERLRAQARGPDAPRSQETGQRPARYPASVMATANGSMSRPAMSTDAPSP